MRHRGLCQDFRSGSLYSGREAVTGTGASLTEPGAPDSISSSGEAEAGSAGKQPAEE
jgi:hypothetical protein